MANPYWTSHVNISYGDRHKIRQQQLIATTALDEASDPLLDEPEQEANASSATKQMLRKLVKDRKRVNKAGNAFFRKASLLESSATALITTRPQQAHGDHRSLQSGESEESLKATINSLEERIHVLMQENVARVDTSLYDDAVRDVGIYKNRAEALEDNQQKLEEDMMSLQLKLSSTEEAERKAVDRLNAAEADTRRYGEEKQAWVQNEAALKQRIQHLENEAHSRAGIEASWEQQESALNAKIQALEEALRTRVEEQTTLEVKNTLLEARVRVLEKSLEVKVRVLEKSLEEQLESQERIISELRTRIKAYDSAARAHKEESDQWASTDSALQQQIKTQQSSLNEARNKVAALEADASASSKKQKELNMRIKELDVQNATALKTQNERDTSRTVDRIKDLQDKNDTLQTKCDNLQTKLEKVHADLVNLHIERDILKVEDGNLQKEVSDWKKTAATQPSDMLQLRTDLRNTSGTLLALISAFFKSIGEYRAFKRRTLHTYNALREAATTAEEKYELEYKNSERLDETIGRLNNIVYKLQDERKERDETIAKQRKDLNKLMGALDDAIDKLQGYVDGLAKSQAEVQKWFSAYQEASAYINRKIDEGKLLPDNDTAGNT